MEVRRSGSEGRRFVGVVAVALLLALVGTVAFVLVRSRSHDSPSTASPAAQVPDGLQASFAPATGVRVGAPTVVTGSILNTGSTALPVSFTVDDLPTGATLTTVLPSPAAPIDGGWWACAGSTCTWTGPGGPQTLAPNGGLDVLLAFTGPVGTVDPGVGVTVAGLPASTVPLQLPDGAPALAADAVTVRMGMPSTVLFGTSTTGSLVVTNFAGTEVAPGALSVAMTPAAVPGLAMSLAGTGWQCGATSCTNLTAVAPLAVAPPITVSASAPADAAPGEGTVTVTAVAQTTSGPIQSSASAPVTMRPPRSGSIGTRVWVAPSSVVDGTTATATIEVAPTGQGTTTEPVTLSLQVPEGFAADWSSTSTEGPWTCGTDGCTSNAPLAAGTQYLLDVPLTIPVGTRPGTYDVAVGASLGTGSDLQEQRASSGSFVVVPAAAVSLRARLTAAGALDPRGGSIGFAPGSERALQVTVTNHGQSPLRAGSAVYVTATPSRAQQLDSAGGDGWSCIPATAGEVSPGWPLRCHTILQQDLATSDTLVVPFSLAADGVGTVDWSVGTGTTMRTASDNPDRARVEVEPNQPRFVASIDEEFPIHDGGTGRLIVRVVNHGDRPAHGGVLVVSLPADATLASVTGPMWRCVDASVAGGDGSVTCSTTSLVAPGAAGPSLVLDVGVTGHPTDLEVSAWTSAVGQFDAGIAEVTHRRFTVASQLIVDAGPDLTVATPVLGSNGTVAPAVVVLSGRADLASAGHLEWSQSCLQPREPGCGDVVSPAVSWLGVPAGRSPTTPTARFVAPAEVTAPTDLFFRLSGTVGRSAVTDVVMVHLVPATFPAASLGGGTDGSVGTGGAGLPQPGPAPTPAPPTASIAGGTSVLQAPTRAAAQLVGGGTGSGTLTYSWTQTSGATASIDGPSDQRILAFTTPTLAPDQQSETLGFQLTVTDQTGASATADATVEVVWGDDGLQVVLAGGATDVVATIDGPVTIASSVTSRGAPYTYEWQVDDLELPDGTVTDLPTLAFAAGDAAADGTATLTVTDSFGRVTTVSIPVIVSALPAGEVPAAFCSAIEALRTGSTATLTGTGVQVTLSTGSISTPTCTTSTIVTFTGAAALLPGGIALSQASGQLTVAGASFTSATVAVPANWSLGPVTIGASGLLAPFVSTSSIGVPTGGLAATSIPFLAAAQWTGSTTITFTASPRPGAVLAATADGPGQGAAVQLDGTVVEGAASVSFSGTGLVGIGPVDLPVAGTVTTTDATTAPVIDATAALAAPATLGAGVTVESATLAWTPAQSTGDVRLTIGTGPGALVLDSPATVIGPTGTTLTFPSSPSSWSTVAGAPSVALVGSGTVQDGQVQISIASSAVAPWSIGAQLALTGFQVSVALDCPLSATTPCGPSVNLAATATGPQFAAPVPVTGSYDPSTGIVTMTGAAGTVTVAPMTVTGASLTVTLGPAVAATATATGPTVVQGVTVPASVAFGPGSTVAQAALGAVTIASGWTIPSATALATTAPYVWTQAIPAAGGAEASVTAAAGVLTGVGVTQLPSDLSSGVLPDDLTQGLVSYSIGAGPVTAYSIAVPFSAAWMVAGSSSSDLSLAVTSMTLAVTTSSAGVNVQVSGQGLLTADAIGGPRTGVVLPFTGALTPQSLSATFTSTTATWPSAFGAAGFTASDLSVALMIDPSSTTVTLSGSMSLPANLSAALSLPAGTAWPFSTDVTAGLVCASITPTSGVDLGGYGFLESASVFVVLSSADCTISDITVSAGITVALHQTSIGNIDLSFDPTTGVLSGSEDDLSFSVGGLSLSDATVAVAPSGVAPPAGVGVPILVSGTATVAGTTVDVAAWVQSIDGLDQLDFSTTLPSLQLGWVTMPSPRLTIVCPAIATTSTTSVAGQSTVRVSGGLPVPGLGALQVQLTGSLEGGAITSLNQVLDSTAYTIAGTDTLTTSLSVSFDSAAAVPMSIAADSGHFSITESPGATRTYELGHLSIGSGGAMTFDGRTSFLNEGLVGLTTTAGTVSGTYQLTSGDYSFANPSTLSASVAGFTSPTTITFARSAGTATATQSSQMTLGIFDSDEVVTMTGTLGIMTATTGTVAATGGTNTLTGSLSGVSMRGLSGNMSFTVQPTTTNVFTGALALEDLVTFDTTSDDCSVFWTSPPTLKGAVYASKSIPYFTFAGQVDVAFPAWFDVGNFPGTGNQPVVISNESLPGTPTATNGLALQIPFSTATYSGSGQIAFDMENCSWTLGGTVAMSWGGGAVGEALSQVLGGGSQPQVQLGSLFSSDGGLPPNVIIARALYQAEQRSIQLQQQAVAQRANAAQLRNDAAAAAEDLDDARTQLQEARQALSAAETALDNAASIHELNSVAAAYAQSASEVIEALAGVRSSELTMGLATRQIAQSQIDVREADTAVTRATEASTTADQLSAEAQANADEATQQANAAAHPKLVQASISYTRCVQCTVIDAVDISGQLMFAGEWVAEIDLQVGLTSSGGSVSLTVGIGMEWQYQVSLGRFGAAINAEAIASITVGGAFGGPAGVFTFNDVEGAVDVSGAIDVWASLGWFSVSAQLASVNGQASIEIVPWPPEYSVSFEVSVGPFSVDLQHGPATLGV